MKFQGHSLVVSAPTPQTQKSWNPGHIELGLKKKKNYKKLIFCKKDLTNFHINTVRILCHRQHTSTLALCTIEEDQTDMRLAN